jgi:hypothetical protein
MATIDREGYKRKATGSFKRVHYESRQYTWAMPGTHLVVTKTRDSAVHSNMLGSSEKFWLR